MATSIDTRFKIRLGGLHGCAMYDNPPREVGSVDEAREAILAHALGALGHHAHDPDKREHLFLTVGPDGPTWEDLAECEKGRRYDPAKPEDGMQCSYFLYRQGGLEGVGGVMWTYGVTIWATAPPEVWDHPASQPLGLDIDDDLNNDLASD